MSKIADAKTLLDAVEVLQKVVYNHLDRRDKKRQEEEAREKELRELREKVAKLEGGK